MIEAKNPDSEISPAHSSGFQPSPGLAALGVSLIVFVIYMLTMNPGIGFIDKGELMADASTLGIAHPTGYPLLMLLSHFFTVILPFSKMTTLNVLSALFTACGIGVMALLFDYLLQHIGDDLGVSRRVRVSVKAKEKKGKNPGGKVKNARIQNPSVISIKEGPVQGTAASLALTSRNRTIYAAAGALFVGLTSTWWNQGNGFEVYSLHALFLPLVSLLFLRYMHEVIRGDSSITGFTKLGFWFSLVLGLSFTNHMSTIYLAPAFLVYYFWVALDGTDGVPGISIGESFQQLSYLAPGFLLGLSPYLWLPIRASMHPAFNWGNPDTWERFINHVTGTQYSVWMFSSTGVFKQQTSYFFGHLPGELAYIGVAAAILGVLLLVRANRKLAVWSALLFLTCSVWAGNYNILDIESYYMLAVLAFGIWAAAGLVWLDRRAGHPFALAGAGVLVVATFAINLGESNESNNHLVSDMTSNMMATVPKNAIVISSQWDFWVSGSWYMQAVEGMRPDVRVIDQELLRRSWYLDQLERNYPEVMGKIKLATDAFRHEVYKFEHDEPYDPNTIQMAYVGLVNAIIDSNIATRPVVVTGDVEEAMGVSYQRVPNYLGLRLTKDSTYLPQTYPNYAFRFWDHRVDTYAAKIYELYARSFLARSMYEHQYGHDSLASRYYNQALAFDPGYKYSDISDQPLNGEEQLKGLIDFFGEVRSHKP